MHDPRSENSGKLVQYSGLLLLFLAVAFVTVFVVAAFNPGCLDADTLDQWGQSGSKIYRNWHPVTLTLIMTYVRPIYNGLQAIVVLQVVLFAAGVLLILRRHAGPLVRSGLLLCLTFVPPVLAYLGYVNKDAFMTSLLVLAIGIIYEYRNKQHPVLLLLSLITLYLAFAVRHNAVFAVVPLLAWLFFPRRWFVTGPCIIIVLLSFAGLEKATVWAFHVRGGYPEQCTYLYDLAALSAKKGVNLVPPEFEMPWTTLALIQRDVNPSVSDQLFFGNGFVFHFSDDPELVRRLMVIWMKSIVRYPKDYLQWRWNVFAGFLGLRPFEIGSYVECCVPANNQGFVTVDSRLHWRIMKDLQVTRQSLFFRPYFYLCILMILVVVGTLQKRYDIMMIALSGILYSIVYAVIISAGVFRFACFTVFVCLVLIARLIAEYGTAKLVVNKRLLPLLYVAGSIALAVGLALTIHRAWPRSAVLAGALQLSNGDFEAGTLSPWTLLQDSQATLVRTPAQEGNYSLAESSGPGGVYQDVHGLRPGHSYRISAIVSASPGATALALLRVSDPSTSLVVSSDQITPQTGWLLLPLKVVAGSSGDLRIELVRGSGTGTIYWDNVRLYDR